MTTGQFNNGHDRLPDKMSRLSSGCEIRKNTNKIRRIFSLQLRWEKKNLPSGVTLLGAQATKSTRKQCFF